MDHGLDADRISENIPWIGRNHHQQNLEDLLGLVRISRTKVKVEADTVDQTDANYHFFNFRTSRLQWSWTAGYLDKGPSVEAWL